MVLAVPDAYLQEYCEHIHEVFKIPLTEGQLSRFFNQTGISRKVVCFD